MLTRTRTIEVARSTSRMPGLFLDVKLLFQGASESSPRHDAALIAQACRHAGAAPLVAPALTTIKRGSHHVDVLRR